jgi:hypothetical protein
MPYSARYPQGRVFDHADHPAMIEAIVWLSRERIAFARVSPHQLKIGPTHSFYPVKGTIMHDGRKPFLERGLVALKALLRRPTPDVNPEVTVSRLDQSRTSPGSNAVSPTNTEFMPPAAPDPSPSNSTSTQINSLRLGTTVSDHGELEPAGRTLHEFRAQCLARGR